MKRFTCKIILLLLAVTLQANWQKAADVLSAEGGNSGDHFGFSVDVGKEFAVVGAPDDPAGGAAYIFKKEPNGTWSQMQRLDYSTSQARNGGLAMSYIDGFGASVAIAENVAYGNINPHLIVVGAPDSYFHTYDDGLDHRTGAICTFEYNASTEIWGMQGGCRHGDLALDDDHSFGYSVDISNWVMMLSLDGILHYFSHANIIVGDPHRDNTYQDEGEVIFFDYNSSGHSWNETAVVSDPSTWADQNIQFGFSVALDKGLAIIGAPGTAQAIPEYIHQVGKAYFYNVGGIYISEFKLIHSGILDGYRFGISVDINGDYAIVGEEHRLGGDSFGAAYILKKTDADWVENALLEGSVHGYGTSVAINNAHAAVGAPTRNYYNKFTGAYVYTGAVYIYDNNGNNNWSESLYNTGTSQSFFGISVSLYNNSIMVGAHGAEYVQPYQSLMPFNPALIMYLLD